jgi:hypothetical protein
MQKEAKTAKFMIRMQPLVKAAGEKAAAAENRSLASFMETLLIERLREKGYLQDEQPATKAADTPKSESKPARKKPQA